MKRIVLKIDVNTRQGALTGVPALLALFDRYQASGTFFFSFGPERGFQAQTTLLRNCLCSICFHGHGPQDADISKDCGHILREALTAGFEIDIDA